MVEFLFTFRKKRMDYVSCIIPYYNEQARIGHIVKVVVASEWIKEVILVNDGSDDGGYIGPKHPKIKHLKHAANKGKSAAMKTGFFEAKEKFVMFLDADLNGLTTKHIDHLILPVLNGSYEVSISKREYFSFFDVFTGDRVMNKNDWDVFFQNVNATNNGTEIRMNRFTLLSQMKFCRVNWTGVTQTYKAEKIGYFKGMIKDFSYVYRWMNELGYACYSVTYLYFWIIMLSKNDFFNKVLYNNYFSMYHSSISYLAIPSSSKELN